MEAYAYLGHTPEEFPVAHSQMGRLLSLPMYPELTRELTEYVGSTLKTLLSRSLAAKE
jgi:dTDP-4-amino-4,6-dideoxygalactose transaminase